MSQYVVSVESSSLTHHRLYSFFFVSYVDSLMGQKTFMRTKCFQPLRRFNAEGSDPVKHV